MARQHYKNSTLVGNWYEDRLDNTKAYNPELQRTGKYGQTPLEMANPVPDRFLSISASSHCLESSSGSLSAAILNPPDRYLANSNNPYSFVNHKTINNISATRVIAEGVPAGGFGAVLPRHPPDHFTRQLKTTTHSAFGGKYGDNSEEKSFNISITSNFAAGQSTLGQDAVHKGVHASGPADPFKVEDASSASKGTARTIGERLEIGQNRDIKQHTFVQRSWIPNRDSLQSLATIPKDDNVLNIEGLSLSGQGSHYSTLQTKTKFTKKNDALKHETGIWNEF